MLSLNAEGSSLPVLTDPIEQGRDDPDKNIDRSNTRFGRIVRDDIGRRLKIVTMAGIPEFALNSFEDKSVRQIQFS
jgi:hypothetical protein